MGADAVIERILVSKHEIEPEYGRLTRDRTAEPVSRDQILRRERGEGNIHILCSADHELSGVSNLTQLIHHFLAICDDDTS